jgi:hypothetical protein
LEWQLNDERPMHKLIEPGDLHLNTQGVNSGVAGIKR